jgi:hypothetical protein
MNLYKTESCSVATYLIELYVGSFACLFFDPHEIVFNSLLAFLVQSNKLCATAEKGCRLKNEIKR